MSSPLLARAQRSSPGRPSPLSDRCILCPRHTLDNKRGARLWCPPGRGALSRHVWACHRPDICLRFCHMRLLSWMQVRPRCVRQGDVSALYLRSGCGMQRVHCLHRARSIPDRGFQALAGRAPPQTSAIGRKSVTDSCAIPPWRKGAHSSRAIARKALAGIPRTNPIDIQQVVMQSRAARMTTVDRLGPSLTGRICVSTVVCYASSRHCPPCRGEPTIAERPPSCPRTPRCARVERLCALSTASAQGTARVQTPSAARRSAGNPDARGDGAHFA